MKGMSRVVCITRDLPLSTGTVTGACLRMVFGVLLMTAQALYANADSAELPGIRNFKITESAVSDRLSQKTVRELFQDSRGFLWIRTRDAIYRYDGYELRSFLPDSAVLGALGHGAGRKIVEDSQGTIWLATPGLGLTRYDVRTRKFVQALSKNRDFEISTIHAGADGTIWLGLVDGSIAVYDPVSRSIVFTEKSIAEGNTIKGFISDNRSFIWALTAHGTLIKCRIFPNQCAVDFDLREKLERPIARAFIMDSAGQIWIGTESDGLLKISTDRETMEHFFHVEGQPESLPGDSIQYLYSDRSGRIWVCTDQGVSLVENAGKFLNFDYRNTYLGKYVTLSMLQDSNDNYWIGTHFGLYSGKQSAFSTFDELAGLQDNVITAFAESSTGGIYIASYNGLSYIDDLENPDLTTPAHSLNSSLRDPRVMSLLHDTSNLWIGYRFHGFARLDGKTLRESDIIGHTIPNTSAVIAIQQLPGDKLLVSTFGDGVFVIDKHSGDTRNLRNDSAAQGALSSNKIFTSFQTSAGDILLGTVKGLSRFSASREEVETIVADADDGRFIESAKVLSIAEDRRGNIWLGTQNAGLVLWDADDRRQDKKIFTQPTTDPALPSATIYAMQTDNNDDLWMSTTNGLVRMNTHNREIAIFDNSDGLQDKEFNFGASFKDSRGRLYFGGNRGFNRFLPDNVRVKTRPPPLQLTKVDIAGKGYSHDVGYTPIEELKLGHEDYFVNFQFSVLDFTNPAANQYRYKLENFDRDWIDIGTRHNASFTNLPPGRFTFKVSGANSEGVWNHEGIRIPLSVYPPPWLRWWAFSIYTGFFMGLVVSVRKYYDKHREKEEATRYAELMSRTTNRALDNLDERWRTDQKLIRRIYDRNEELINIVADLLEFQAESIDDNLVLEGFQATQHRLSAITRLQKHLFFSGDMVELNLYDYVEEMLPEIFPSAQYTALEIVGVNNVLNSRVPARVGLAAGMIVHELARNAAKHAFEGATGIQTFQVSFAETSTGSAWTLEVSDSGIGLPDNVNPQVPATTGMMIIDRFCKEVEASVEIERERGSLFRFRFPRLKRYYANS